MLVFLPESVFSVRSRGLFLGRKNGLRGLARPYVPLARSSKTKQKKLLAQTNCFFFSGLLIISININLSVSSQSLLLPQMGLRRKQVSSRNFEGRGA